MQEPHQIVFWAAWLSAPTAWLGRERRKATEDICWGHTAAEGAVAAHCRQCGERVGPLPGRGEGRGCSPAGHNTPGWPVGRWGSRWAQGEMKGRELSCGLRSRAPVPVRVYDQKV